MRIRNVVAGLALVAGLAGAQTGPAQSEQEKARRESYAKSRYGDTVSTKSRVYIQHGPPDEIESHPRRPYERWFYRSLPGVGENVSFEFNPENRPRPEGSAPQK